MLPGPFYDRSATRCLACGWTPVDDILQKGDRVVVSGRGEVEKWTGKDGVERSSRKIICDGLGPDLRFTTADVHRSDRRQADYTHEEPF